MNEIAKHRAEKLQDSREWTARDALEDTLAAIKDKPNVQIAIHWWEKDPEGGQEHCFSVAGMTTPEHIALLAVATAETLNHWKK